MGVLRADSEILMVNPGGEKKKCLQPKLHLLNSFLGISLGFYF